MATTEALTVDDLRARLAEHQSEVEEAERATGAAALDGVGERAAAKRLAAAYEAVRRTAAALEELERRDRVAADGEAEAIAAGERQATYAWAARYFRLAEVVLRRGGGWGGGGAGVGSLGGGHKKYRRQAEQEGAGAPGGGGRSTGRR